MHRDGVRCKPRRDQRLFETRRIIKPVQSRCHKRPLFHARVFGDVGDQPPTGRSTRCSSAIIAPSRSAKYSTLSASTASNAPVAKGIRRSGAVSVATATSLDPPRSLGTAPQSPARSAPPDSPRILGERSRRTPRGSGARSGPRCGRGSLMAPWFQSQGATGEPDPHTAGQRNVRQRALIGWNLYRHYHSEPGSRMLSARPRQLEFDRVAKVIGKRRTRG